MKNRWELTEHIVTTLQPGILQSGKRRIVIYGTTFFLAGIGEYLKQSTNFEIIILPPSSQAVETIATLCPDLIIAEQEMLPELFPLLCPPQNRPIIGLSTRQNVMTVLHGDSYPVRAFADLIAIIQEVSVTAPQPSETLALRLSEVLT